MAEPFQSPFNNFQLPPDECVFSESGENKILELKIARFQEYFSEQLLACDSVNAFLGGAPMNVTTSQEFLYRQTELGAVSLKTFPHPKHRLKFVAQVVQESAELAIRQSLPSASVFKVRSRSLDENRDMGTAKVELILNLFD